MQFDFAATAKRARSTIAVPDAPMELIRDRATRLRSRSKARAFVIAGAASLAMAGTAAAVVPNAYNGVRVWLLGDKTSVSVHSFVMVREPKAADLRNVVANATFPIVFPVGLPAGAHVWRMQFAPAEHPNAVILEYRNDRTSFRSGFALVDSSAVSTSDALLPGGTARPLSQKSYHWQVGSETVLALKRAVTQQDIRRIRAETMTASPSSSFAETLPMLSKATVLGTDSGLGEITAPYVPATGQTIVLGPRFPGLISELAKAGKPLVASRTVEITDVPTIHGEPDYARASSHWQNGVEISARGVRAIDAVQRLRGIVGKCACAILFNQPTRAAYGVWVLQRSPSVALTKYAVDARTFAVTHIGGEK